MTEIDLSFFIITVSIDLEDALLTTVLKIENILSMESCLCHKRHGIYTCAEKLCELYLLRKVVFIQDQLLLVLSYHCLHQVPPHYPPYVPRDCCHHHHRYLLYLLSVV